MTTKLKAFRRGAHASATQLFREFLHDDMKDYIEKGFWTVLPFRAVKHYAHLKLAPCGVVPQRERRPRPISDYSFAGINQASLPLAPFMSMQFGATLQRLLQRIAYANTNFGPVHMLKFDLADGYYRVTLAPHAALELAVIIPGDNNDTNYVGIPLTLPMGWNMSPPYFCAFTETATDIAALAQLQQPAHTHPLEALSQQPSLTTPVAAIHPNYICPPGPALTEPLAYTDVYMDDFIALAQQPRLRDTLHHTIRGILQIFRDTALPADPPSRRHIISTSKMQKGDATWSTTKTILGWSINSAAGTLQLQPHRATRLIELLDQFATKQRTSRKNWQRLLGELRYMSASIHGAKFLFSILQHVLVDQPRSARLRLSPLVHASLNDWKTLASQLAATPRPIAALVPQAPSYIGAVNASGTGCGGFWLPSKYGHLPQPIAFRLRFPNHIAAQLVSASNPKGSITNSDLELAALVMGAITLQDHAPTAHKAAFAASDNTSAVAWCKKGSTSSVGPNAHLLRWLAQSTHLSNMHLHPVSIPGCTNTIADFCSRSFHLTDQEFQVHLQRLYPIQPLWRIVTPKPEHGQQMTSALLRTMSPWASAPPGKLRSEQPSQSGTTSATASIWTRPYVPAQTPSQPCNSSLIDTAWVSCLPAALRSEAERWETPFAPSARRWPAWVSQTPASTHPVNWTSDSPGNWQSTLRMTTPLLESNQFQSTSCAKRFKL
jgi:hypothetical protein